MAFVFSGLAPAVLMALIWRETSLYPVVFALTFLIASIHSIGVGLPLFLICQLRGWINLVSCVVLGAFIGILPIGILSYPTSEFIVGAWNNGGVLITAAICADYIKPLIYFGLLGAWGGFVFWAVLYGSGGWVGPLPGDGDDTISSPGPGTFSTSPPTCLKASSGDREMSRDTRGFALGAGASSGAGAIYPEGALSESHEPRCEPRPLHDRRWTHRMRAGQPGAKAAMIRMLRLAAPVLLAIMAIPSAADSSELMISKGALDLSTAVPLLPADHPVGHGAIVTLVSLKRPTNLQSPAISTFIVDYPPGASATLHRRPTSGYVLVHVLTGTVRAFAWHAGVGTYRAGQTWSEPAFANDIATANGSTRESARVLVVLITGAPND
jgi:hypothetical protein